MERDEQQTRRPATQRKRRPPRGTGREAEVRRRKRVRQRRQAEQAKANERRTPPRALPRRSVILRLVTMAAVVAAVMMGMTVFFKVQEVHVTGNEKYTAQEIIQASGVEMGENLLTLGKPRAAGRIQAELPYVGDVQIGIKLPNTVNIDITELEAKYVISSDAGEWWIIDDSGKLLEKADEAALNSCTRILGVVLDRPVVNDPAVAKEPEDEEDTDLVGTARERLTAAIEILTTLREDRSGSITQVDVTELYDIQVRYGDQYLILFGGPLDLTYKTRYMLQAVEKLSEDEYRSGVLDLSFSEPGKAVFTPW